MTPLVLRGQRIEALHVLGRSASSEFRLTRRMAANCSGWHCLTAAEQFGIIFSVVVVFIVLLLAYMYLLGRLGMRQQSQNSVRLPGGRTGRRHKALPREVALGEMPIVHQWPGYPPHVVYQPAMYQLGPGAATRAQPYIVPAPFPQQPAPVPYPAPPYRPLIGYQAPAFSQNAQVPNNIQPPQNQPNASPTGYQRPREPTWRQRLLRLFRVPVGRASTIATSSAPGTPVINHPRGRSPENSARNPQTPKQDGGERDLEANRGEGLMQPDKGAPATTLDACSLPERTRESAEFDEIDSLRTNAATVHSDDYHIGTPRLESQLRFSEEESHRAVLPNDANPFPDYDSLTGDESSSDSAVSGPKTTRGSIPSLSSVLSRRGGRSKMTNGKPLDPQDEWSEEFRLKTCFGEGPTELCREKKKFQWDDRFMDPKLKACIDAFPE